MTDILDELSRRPYLVRAMYDWMCDNGQTPHIVVDALVDGVSVPPDHVNNGRIILNIGPGATQGLTIDNESIAFSARFNGVIYGISVPVSAIMGICARESGQGMVFVPDDLTPPPENGGHSGGKSAAGPRSHLKVVK